MKSAVAAFLVSSLLLASACSKKAGSDCEGSASMCQDKASALVCMQGKLAAVACGGPMGCTKFEDRANCDTTIANVSDPCPPDAEEHQSCTPDGKRAVVCEKGRFVRYLECHGENGCTPVGFQVACDMSLANPGEPCKEANKTACSVDGKQQVVCQNGVFVVQRHCRGERGCKNDGGLLTCDVTIADVGDPCLTVGQVVCAADGQSELVCQGGSFQRGRACLKTPCTVSANAARSVVCQ